MLRRGAAEPGLVDTLPHLGAVCWVNTKDSSPKLETALCPGLPLPPPGPSGEAGLFPAPAMPPGRLFENKPPRRVLVAVSRRLLEGLVRPALDQAQWEVDTATACQEHRVHEGVDTRPQCPALRGARKARGPQWGLSLLCAEWPSLAHWDGLFS